MTSSIGVSGVQHTGSSGAPGVAPAPAPAASSGQLANFERQLSDWVHCPSSKTSAGKAKIAEITDKIDTIKATLKKADDAKTPPPPTTAAPTGPTGIRLDGRGTWLNLVA